MISWEAAARSRDVRWAAGLALLALGLRLAFVLGFGRTDVVDEASAGLGLNDTSFYVMVAESLAKGDGYVFFGEQSVQWPPAYPALLAAIGLVFGHGAGTALVVNAVLGASSVLLVYFVGLRALGRRAAIGAAAVLAVFPGQILIGGVALAETLYAFELLAFLALAMALDRRPRALVALGVVAGLAALTRGEGFFFPLIVLAMAYQLGTRANALRTAAAVAGVMLMVVAPWAIRTSLAADSFVPVSTNANETIWSGHNPKADGGALTPPLRVSGEGVPDAPTQAERSRVLRREALDWAVSHPFEELKLIPKKLRVLVLGDGRVIETWINAPGESPLPGSVAGAARALAGVFWYALLLATLASVLLFGRALWRIPVMRGAIVFVALAIPLYGFLYYGNFRYRLPLEPLMILISAGGVTLARRRLTESPG